MGKSRFKHTSLIGNFHYWHSSVFESHKVALKFSSKEKKSPMVWIDKGVLLIWMCSWENALGIFRSVSEGVEEDMRCFLQL